MSPQSMSIRLLTKYCTLAIVFSFPLVSLAQQTTSFSSGFSDNSGVLIARGGGGRGGGGGHRSGGMRSSGGARSHSGGRSAGHARMAQRPSSIHRPSHKATRPTQGHRANRPTQLPSTGMKPGSRPNVGQGQLPNTGMRPSNQPIRPNSPTRPTRPPSEINASRNVNVEGYNGGWGYHGEDYPWGLGAAAGLTGFTLGRVLNALPANSQPVEIQGQQYYESDGVYFEPSSSGGYTVVPPPTGAIEPQLPNGAQPVNKGGHTLYEIQGVYYQPTIHNGQPAYMIVTP